MKDRPLSRLTELASELINAKTGLIEFSFEHPRPSGAPDFFRFVTKSANTKVFGTLENFAIGSGAATTRDMALAKAIGESLERYASAIYDPAGLPLFSYNDAPFECVHPKVFSLYDEEQYAQEGFIFKPFHEDSVVRWEEGIKLRNGESIHIPACYVYMPYIFYLSDETPVVQPISTGMAAHCSPEEAAMSGICEVIERDAFTITWQAMMSPPHVRHESLSDYNKNLIERFAFAGYEIKILDITKDNSVCTILTACLGSKDGPVPLAVAAASSLDPEEAIAKSLEELAHTERFAFQIKEEIPEIDADDDYKNVNSQISHVNYWCIKENRSKADFLFASTKTIDFNDLPNHATGDLGKDLKKISDLVYETGHEVILCDLTTDDLDPLGISVVRAIIPGYNPLAMGFAVRSKGGERLWTVPQKLGYPGINRETGDNPYPHPFP